MPDTITYSNPRREATIEDWPVGRQKRAKARFWIESNKRGERVCRVLTGKPKKSTYALRCVIVDGSDEKTYYIQETKYGFFSVMYGDMKYSHERVFPEDPRYEEVDSLFKET